MKQCLVTQTSEECILSTSVSVVLTENLNDISARKYPEGARSSFYLGIFSLETARAVLNCLE